MKYITIASVQYSPGLGRELAALARGMEEEGATVSMILEQRYEPIVRRCGFSGELVTLTCSSGYVRQVLQAPLIACRLVAALRCLPGGLRKQAFIAYNPHLALPLTLFVLACLQRSGGRSVAGAFTLHEPRILHAFVYGRKRALQIRLIEHVQALCVRLATDIVVMSNEGLRRFCSAYPRYVDKVHLARIYIDASAVVPARSGQRNALLILGHINEGKGIEKVVQAVRAFGYPRGMDRLVIASASPLPPRIARLLAEIPPDRLSLRCGTTLSDEEIVEMLADARAVALMHTEGSQSGVLPLALAYGAGVLCAPHDGLTQHLAPGAGLVFPQSDLPGDIWRSLEYAFDPIKDVISREGVANAASQFTLDFCSSDYGWLLRADQTAREARMMASYSKLSVAGALARRVRFEIEEFGLFSAFRMSYFVGIGRLRRSITTRLRGTEFHMPAAIGVRAGVGGMIYARGARFERELAPYFQEMVKAGACVVDVGANLGFWSTFLCQRLGDAGGGRVICVEPEPSTVRYLKRNVAAASSEGVDVDVLELALGAEDGRAGLAYHKDDIGSTSLGEGESVELRRLDGVLADMGVTSLSGMKVDVEGYELHVLRGASRSLERCPIVICEVIESHLARFGHTGEELLCYMAALGFDAFRVPEGGTRAGIDGNYVFRRKVG